MKKELMLEQSLYTILKNLRLLLFVIMPFIKVIWLFRKLQ